LSIAEGDDGRALIHCFVGCSVHEIARALGIELRDLFPPRPDVQARPRTHSKPQRVSRELAATLLARPALVLEVEVAKMLARLPERVAQRHVLESWDALAQAVDIPFTWRLAQQMRGAAVLNFGRADDFSPRWSDELGSYAIAGDGCGRAVDRMMRRVER